ncbi:SusD/RagB family nutrient-binding outer membrane lipoprotein [Flagellimonas alvinocaridis]|uniref:SusD/RagB family nutrient-binding outer membrane lipoprotein n=1 Tax=Flagellimonas alvinocaridis TaxID=2530200 RepID=A0A4S8RW64_9FLAO|nr:SusD/RagB family nutrient-binding outer membrane lipoprotein [Allomuricauda alvinocaridis]THV59549.1 SusD/RagB family nutrient-binding outer membrane lipoprotein [Allomuricauda alvinocaridis]
MKKIRISIEKVFLLCSLMFVVGCSEDYFDVNTPSNTATEEELRMQDLMAPVMHSTMEGQRSAELSFGNYVQYFVNTGGGAAGQTSASGLWEQVYLYILPNLQVIKAKAEENGSTHIDAIADILTAINIGIATDTWDNIPYSEAGQGPENNFPTFDTQEEIYTEIFALLDAAIAKLETTDNSVFSLGSSDLIYGGDTDKWLRAAYSLKARYQLHLVNKGIVSANDVLATVENGFTSNDDNFAMYYDDRNINPWYSEEILARNTGNLSKDIASQLVSSMNGEYFPFQGGIVEIDPRLPLFAENNDEAEYKGYVSGGGGIAPDGTDANTGFRTDGFYTSVDSPLILISYAEVLFIKAEAAFLANGGNETSVGSSATAYTAYLDGIAASMGMYDVDGTDYMADGAIAVGEAGLMLNHIMKEKYIHNFLNPETFVDYRRYDFSDDVFTGLQIRSEEESADTEFPGQWFRRANYPASELTRNEANVLANQQDPVDPVWWDE